MLLIIYFTEKKMYWMIKTELFNILYDNILKYKELD